MAEINVAACVAFARPEAMQSVIHSILDGGFAEVPRSDASGRMVVLIERGSSREVIDAIDAIRAIEGVLALHLAYQHAEMDEDVPETP